MEDVKKIQFLVNTDSKEFVNVETVGLDTTTLISQLQKGRWSGKNMIALNKLDLDFQSFTDVSRIFLRNDTTDEPFITEDFPDAKTQIITIHSKRKKQL